MKPVYELKLQLVCCALVFVAMACSCRLEPAAPWASEDDRGWRMWRLYLSAYRLEFGRWPDNDRDVLKKLNTDERADPEMGGALGKAWRFNRVKSPDEPPDGPRATYDVRVERDGFAPCEKRLPVESVYYAKSTYERYRNVYRERPKPPRSTPKPARSEAIDAQTK